MICSCAVLLGLQVQLTDCPVQMMLVYGHEIQSRFGQVNQHGKATGLAKACLLGVSAGVSKDPNAHKEKKMLEKQPLAQLLTVPAKNLGTAPDLPVENPLLAQEPLDHKTKVKLAKAVRSHALA